MSVPSSGAIGAIDETDFRQSSFRENLLEHIFIAEVLQEAWCRRRQVIEVLRSEVDDSGYDVVLVSGASTRHIQLKSSREGAKTAEQTINIRLAERPGGCVVWLFFTEDRTAGKLRLRYEFFGGGPEQKLPLDERRHKVGKHTKANARGVFLERPMTRVIPRRDFVRLDGTAALLAKLFGHAPVETRQDGLPPLTPLAVS